MSICIFCGKNRKRNREHIFPVWLQTDLGISGEELRIFTGSQPELKRKLNFGSHLAGHVCEECNSGWMSTLETSARPIIETLLEDNNRRALSHTETSTLAMWIWKTVLTLHSASVDEKIIPSYHYELAFNQKIPGCFMIHIAHLENRLDTPSWIQNRNWLEAERHLSGDALINALRLTYRITIGFGHLAARVIYFPLKLPLFPLEEGVISIYPPAKDIIWPPEISIEDLWEMDSGVVVRASFPESNLNDGIFSE